ncbi:MAG TPA: hypothetical protein VFC14_26120 [Burkholderiales bacterium]|jgi:hypothetical protein|nr:hypothetical protein [Burkholderiales bacterium]
MTIKTLAVTALAMAVIGLADDASAQSGARLFFEGDMVRGDQQGAPGPFCVLTNQFKRLEKVVWRIRVLDQTGKEVDSKGLKTLVVQLPDGQALAGRFGPHPPARVGPAEDHFWTAAWTIPAGYPSGTFVYKVVATDVDGKAHTWEPFKRSVSQLQVIPGEIEIKKPEGK